MQEMIEMPVKFLRQEDSPEKEMATHSVVLPGKIPWTEDPEGLQSIGSQKLDMAESLCTHTNTETETTKRSCLNQIEI